MDIIDILDRYAFQDHASIFGRVAYELGNVYQRVGVGFENSSALFQILQRPIHEWKDYLEAEKAKQVLGHTLEVINEISGNIFKATPARIDKEILKREFNLSVNLLRHACFRGLFGYGSINYSKDFLAKDLGLIIDEYTDIWLLRNRPGGLNDSLKYFKIPLKDYE